MKMTTEVIGKASQKIRVTIQMEASKYELRRDEMTRWKRKMQNRVHAILREDGYDANQIKIVK